MSDYYSALGVKKGAPSDEIKKAYRRLAKKYHPDATGGNEGAKKKFIEVNEAYETLSDPEKRKAYDAERENPFKERGHEGGNPFGGHVRYEHASARGGVNFDDLLSDLFGGRTATATQAMPLDIAAQCDITPWLAALGGRIEVAVSGKTLSIKVPPGAKSGQKLRLRGQGLSGGQGKQGDLVIELTIQNPKTLTPEMKRLYEQLGAL